MSTMEKESKEWGTRKQREMLDTLRRVIFPYVDIRILKATVLESIDLLNAVHFILTEVLEEPEAEFITHTQVIEKIYSGSSISVDVASEGSVIMSNCNGTSADDHEQEMQLEPLLILQDVTPDAAAAATNKVDELKPLPMLKEFKIALSESSSELSKAQFEEEASRRSDAHHEEGKEFLPRLTDFTTLLESLSESSLPESSAVSESLMSTSPHIANKLALELLRADTVVELSKSLEESFYDVSSVDTSTVMDDVPVIEADHAARVYPTTLEIIEWSDEEKLPLPVRPHISNTGWANDYYYPDVQEHQFRNYLMCPNTQWLHSHCEGSRLIPKSSVIRGFQTYEAVHFNAQFDRTSKYNSDELSNKVMVSDSVIQEEMDDGFIGLKESSIRESNTKEAVPFTQFDRTSTYNSDDLGKRMMESDSVPDETDDREFIGLNGSISSGVDSVTIGSPNGSSSSQLQLGVDALDGLVEGAKCDKEALVAAIAEMRAMRSTVEQAEAAAEQVKKATTTAGEDVLAQVDEMQQMLVRARQANEMHAGDVYGEKAVLGTESLELQRRLAHLKAEMKQAFAAVEEIRSLLQGRIDRANAEREAADTEKRVKEESARSLLAREEEEMAKGAQESRDLDAEEEACATLRNFLIDRGYFVDLLQGEVAIICEDVEFVKKQLDEGKLCGDSSNMSFVQMLSSRSQLSNSVVSHTDITEESSQRIGSAQSNIDAGDDEPDWHILQTEE